MSDAPIVLLSQGGSSARAVYHRLKKEFEQPVHAVVERPVPPLQLVRGRYRKLGLQKVAGQLAFQVFIQRILERAGRRRLDEIGHELDLDLSDIPAEAITHVDSVNEEACRQLLRQLQPRVVVLAGTRIVGHATLGCVDAVFVNMHAGVTPGYRGVHGGYWALADGRPDLVGTTVHVVDEGIDTGAVLEQVFFSPGPRDHFGTYPLLHVGYGLPALVRGVRAALQGQVATTPGAAYPSRLRYHPTLFEYLSQAVLRGVR